MSILFADICSFTSLTTTLSVDKLVETLNDLFGKFDDAAEVKHINSSLSHMTFDQSIQATFLEKSFSKQIGYVQPKNNLASQKILL